MSFKKRSVYFVAALSAVLSLAAVASAKYKAQNAEVKIHVEGPPGMSVDGASSNLVIDETDKTITFKTFLNSMDTKNKLRNKHMFERFDGATHKDVTLTVDKDKIKKGGTIDGTLKFHGVSRPVKVHYAVKDKEVSANFEFLVTNHGVKEDAICYLKVCVNPKVAVTAKFDLAE